MKNFFASFILVIFCLGSLSAQTFFKNSTQNLSLQTVNIDTVKILAVMVQYQKDNDVTTVGNGQFDSIYTKEYGDSIIDPLPHNRQYFEAHLEFAKNYYRKVSNNKVVVSYLVLDSVFTLSKQMRNYSPTIKSNDFSLMGEMTKETWQLVESKYPNLRFSDFNKFVIFHAGVGRDVTLPGSLGNERDIPSVFLSLSSLRNIYGPTFAGFPVQNGNFNITNSAILPQTQNREVSSFAGTYLLELTINGLIVSGIGSFLGLPDLFDTKTGLTAIGRLGLMDGQAIFAYNGLFPPAPSAWERIFLGWEIPKVLSPNDTGVVSLAVRNKTLPLESSIIKIPISSSEYFLIENRQRDANGDKANITMWVNGRIIQRNFQKDTTGFYSFDIDSLQGVVIDVDEFDWALPGSGILIWHIDENIINQNLLSNKVNADINNRGIKLIEADGIKDIGVKFRTIFGDELVGEGTQEDFWYRGNEADLFKNVLDDESRPNSNSNSGARSLISLKNFSENSNRMTFNFSVGNESLALLSSTQLPNFVKAANVSSANHPSNNSYYITDEINSKVYQLNQSGTIVNTFDLSGQKPLSFSSENLQGEIVNYLIGSKNNRIQMFARKVSGLSTSFFDAASRVTTSPIITSQNVDSTNFIVGLENGEILKFTITRARDTVLAARGLLKNISTEVNFINYNQNYYSVVSQNKIFGSDNSTITLPNNIIQSALTVDAENNFVTVVLDSEGKIYCISDGKIFSEFRVGKKDEVSSFSIADIRGDGNNYIIYNKLNNIEAKNLSGVNADNFPYTYFGNANFIGQPLVGNILSGSNNQIISTTDDGQVYVIDPQNGKSIAPFPISSSKIIPNTLMITNNSNTGKKTLSAVTQENFFSIWDLKKLSSVSWSERLGNQFNNSFIPKATGRISQLEFFPQALTYNWPNPVYENKTYIRYFVSEDSKIDIKIFDITGNLIHQMNANAIGGMDNESVWDVSNVQSGVYLTRVEAVANSGEKKSHIIKIAVIK